MNCQRKKELKETFWTTPTWRRMANVQIILNSMDVYYLVPEYGNYIHGVRPVETVHHQLVRARYKG